MLNDLLSALLRSKVLVILSHPDDEAVALGAFMQVCCQAELLFLTSGDGNLGSNYPVTNSTDAKWHRESEARTANQLLPNVTILGFERFPDKHLAGNLTEIAARLMEIVAAQNPQYLMTHSFEGGHPDHDSCSFLASRIGRLTNIPVVEFPEYSAPPLLRVQSFGSLDGVATLNLTEQQAAIKRQLFSLHASQASILAMFDPNLPETFRIQLDHPYYNPCWTKYFVDVGYTPEMLVRSFKAFEFH